MANWVEQATLVLVDKASKNAAKINAELTKLLATANKLKSVKIDIKGLSQSSSQVRNLTRDMQKLASTKVQTVAGAKVPTITPTQVTSANQYAAAMAKIAAASNRVRALPPIPAAMAGGGGRGSRGGGVPPASSGRVPSVPLPQGGASWGAQAARAFNDRVRDGESAGRAIAGGFLSAIGGKLQNMVSQAVSSSSRSAGRGIVTADDARAMLAGSGVRDISGAEAAARSAASRTKGVSAGEILGASTEAIGNLQAQLDAGKITFEQYGQQVQDLTDRIARNSQIYAVTGKTQEQAAEGSRQMEKAISLLNASTDPTKAKAFSDAILQGQVASGGDVGSAEVVRMLQQLGSVKDFLSPAGVRNAALARDEGGQRSTADIRMGIQALTRLNKTDKAQAAQIAAGLRNADGTTALTREQLSDPVAVALDTLAPRLDALGVDLNDATKVNAALQSKLGFTQPESTFFTNQIVNRESLNIERRRADQVQPEVLRQQETLRVNLQEVQSSFQDLAVTATKSLLPVVKGSLDVISGSLDAASGGDPVAVAKIAAAAVPVAFASSAQALLDPATAPLGAAGLSLTASAAALTASAGALTASAAAGAVSGGVGDAAGAAAKGGWRGLLVKGGALAAIALALKSSTPDNKYTSASSEDRQAMRDVARAEVTRINNAKSLQEGGEGRTDRESIAQIAAAAAANAALKVDMGAARVANADALAKSSTPIPVTITGTDIPPVAQTPMSAMAAQAMQTQTPGTLKQTADTFLIGMEDSQARFATTFQTGAADMQTGITQGVTSSVPMLTQAGSTFGSNAAAALLAVGDQVAAKIRAAGANINVNVSGAGNTLPAAAPANTGATPPVE